MGNEKLNSAKLAILQLLNLEKCCWSDWHITHRNCLVCLTWPIFYLALQRGVGADVLEETWLVVDPQLLLLLLALLVVLVQLAHLREETNNFPFLRKVSSSHTLVWIKFSSSQSTESKQIREQRGNIRIGRKIIVFFRELMDQS